MTSVMGLLEERERAAQVRVEELREEVERVRFDLLEAEAVLERRVVARVELTEALAGTEPEPGTGGPVPSAIAVKVPGTGSIVPQWRAGLGVEALAPHYQRLVGVLEAEAGEVGLRAGDLAGRLGLERVPAKVEGLRSKVKRLVERGWLVEEGPGLFKPRRAAG